MSDADRFLWYAAVGTALVGLFAGVVGTLTLFGPFGSLSYLLYGASDLAARASTLTLWALWGVVGFAYLAIPVAVTVYRVRRDGPVLHHLVRGIAGLLPVPGLLAGLWVVTERPRDATWLAVVVGLVVILGLLVAGEALVRRRERDHRTAPAATFLNVVVLVVFLAAFVLGGAGAGAADAGEALTHELRDGMVPQTAFAFEYEPGDGGRGVLTVTHDGGDAVAANRLHIEGDVAAVDGATQTAEGPWRGEATGRRIAGERSVAPGDSVTVGVEADCVVRIVWSLGDSSMTLGKYTCDA